MRTEKKKKLLNYLIVFLCAFAFRAMLYVRGFKYELRTDDFGPLIYPAYLAGIDWSDFVTAMVNYYGFGYSWIYAPIFLVVHSGEQLIMSISLFNSVVVALVSVLIYHISRKYLKINHTVLAVSASVLCTLYISDGDSQSFLRLLNTDNEVPLFLLCWLTAFILMKALEHHHSNQKKRWLIAVLMAVTLIWGLMIHERSLALSLAVVIVEAAIFLFCGEWLLSPFPFFGTYVIGFIFQRFLRSNLIHYFYYTKDSVTNTDALKNVTGWFLESFHSFKVFLIVIFGNLHNYMTKGFGLPFLAFVLLCGWFLRSFVLLLKRKRKENTLPEYSMLLLLVFQITVFIIIAGLGSKWGIKLRDNLAAGVMGKGYKGVSYIRYYYVFTGPVVLGTITWLYAKKEAVERSKILFTWITAFVVEGFFLWKVYPFCDNETYLRRNLVFDFFADSSNMCKMALTIVGVGVILFLISCVRSKRLVSSGIYRNRILPMIPLFLLLILVCRRAKKIDFSEHGLKFERSAELYQVLDKIEESEIGAPDIIFTNLGTDWGYNYTVQLHNFKQKVIWGLPDDEKLAQEKVLVISKGPNEYMETKQYESYKVSGYQVYTNQDIYEEIMSSYK